MTRYILALVGALAISLAACGGQASAPSRTVSAAGNASTKLVAAYAAAIPTQLPVWTAAESGIFRNNGLDVDLHYIASTAAMEALVAGDVQAHHGNGSEALAAVLGGADLSVVAVFAPVYPYVLQVIPTIKTPADLKGASIGISAFGTSSDTAARVAVRKLGLDPDKDVRIMAVGSLTNRMAAIQSGAIQGGVAQPPESLQFEAKGFHTLIDLSELDLPTPGATVTFKRSYVASHRDTVQKYVDSLVQAAVRAKRDKASTLQVIKKYTQSDDQQAIETSYDYYTGKVITPLALPKPEQFDDPRNELAAKNPKALTFDVASILDSSFVQSAIDRGLAKWQ